MKEMNDAARTRGLDCGPFAQRILNHEAQRQRNQRKKEEAERQEEQEKETDLISNGEASKYRETGKGLTA